MVRGVWAGLQDGWSADVVHQSDAGDDEQAANYDSAPSLERTHHISVSVTSSSQLDVSLKHSVMRSRLKQLTAVLFETRAWFTKLLRRFQK